MFGLTLFICDLMLRVFRVEVVLPYNSERIGHQVHEPRAYVIRHTLARSTRRFLFVVNKAKVANRYMHALWASRYRFLNCRRTAWMNALYDYARSHPRGAFRYEYCTDEYAKRRSFSDYSGMDRLVDLPAADVQRGAELLEGLGIPKDAWLVCLHVREGGFLPHLSYNSFRDADIMTYLPALKLVTDRGGYVVRMGDPSMRKLPEIPRVFDYAHCKERADFLDIYLCHRCRFYLGQNSGLIEVPFLFQKPLILTNVVPFLDSYPGQLYTPKLIYDDRLKRPLSYREVVERGIPLLYRSEDFHRAGLRLINNDVEDIEHVVEEQFMKLDGRLAWGPEDEPLKSRHEQLLQTGGFAEGACPLISPAFLRKHAGLFRG